MPEDCDWIFFDCFNTLIDDFDDNGEVHGLCSLPDLAVKLGLFTARRDFITAYLNHRRDGDPVGGEVYFHRGKSRPQVTPTPAGITAISDWSEFR